MIGISGASTSTGGHPNITIRNRGRHARVAHGAGTGADFPGWVEIDPPEYDAVIGRRRPQAQRHRNAAVQADAARLHGTR
jgi:hypothetical protein